MKLTVILPLLCIWATSFMYAGTVRVALGDFVGKTSRLAKQGQIYLEAARLNKSSRGNLIAGEELWKRKDEFSGRRMNDLINTADSEYLLGRSIMSFAALPLIFVGGAISAVLWVPAAALDI